MVGLPKSIIKKYGISKKAWTVYRGKKTRKSNPRPKKARKVTKKVARRRYSRKKSRRSRKFTVPLAPVLGIMGGLVSPSTWSGGNSVLGQLMKGEIEDAGKIALYHYLGVNSYTGGFEIDGLKTGLVPLIMGALVHKFVGGSPLNVNRMLAAANVPLLRV